jgi:hypothetical protein
VYLSDFLKVKYSLDHTEKYLVRSALTLGSIQFFHDFRLRVCGERPAMVNPMGWSEFRGGIDRVLTRRVFMDRDLLEAD